MQAATDKHEKAAVEVKAMNRLRKETEKAATKAEDERESKVNEANRLVEEMTMELGVAKRELEKRQEAHTRHPCLTAFRMMRLFIVTMLCHRGFGLTPSVLSYRKKEEWVVIRRNLTSTAIVRPDKDKEKQKLKAKAKFIEQEIIDIRKKEIHLRKLSAQTKTTSTGAADKRRYEDTQKERILLEEALVQCERDEEAIDARRNEDRTADLRVAEEQLRDVRALEKEQSDLVNDINKRLQAAITSIPEINLEGRSLVNVAERERLIAMQRQSKAQAILNNATRDMQMAQEKQRRVDTLSREAREEQEAIPTLTFTG